MGETTAISWTDHTFNPWWGCVKVSPACQHCYAETFAKRTGHNVWGANAPRRFFGAAHWADPVKWHTAAEKARTRRRVFCASMADVFEAPPDIETGDKMREARQRLAGLIRMTPWLDWLLLTKRPENVLTIFPSWFFRENANAWIGTTVENAEYAEKRLPELRLIPASVRFVSYEPALGPVNWSRWLTGIHWLIAGGESGNGARSPQIGWFREARDACAYTGAAFHFKQWGGRIAKANGCELDGREWKEFPNVERPDGRG